MPRSPLTSSKGLLRGLGLFLLLAWSLGAGELMIAAGAGYKEPVNALIDAYGKRGGEKPAAFFGNMRQVIAQAEFSGKVAIIVGDRKFLEKSGLPVARTLPLGEGKLALAWPKGEPVTPEGLKGEKVGRIGLPDPKKAIYGKAADQYLRCAGLEEAVREKLRVFATVPQVSAYLVTGEIDAGFVNLTDALRIKEKIGGYKVVEGCYDPIAIVAAVLEGKEEAPETAVFLRFLESPEARLLLEKRGL